MLCSDRRTTMNGLPGMRGVKVVTGAAAAVLLIGLYGPGARPGRHDRGCAGARLSEQPAAQRAARPGALHRRKRAAGVVRLSSESRGHRQRRLPIYRHAHHMPAARPTSHRPQPILTAPTRRAASAPPSRRRCSTASRPPTRPARRRARSRRARSLARARADRAALGRHHLHGLSARLRHRRGSEEQRPRARTDAEADQGPLQCRRGHPHRRRAVGSAACRRQDRSC